jgi:hypothetical protein
VSQRLLSPIQVPGVVVTGWPGLATAWLGGQGPAKEDRIPVQLMDLLRKLFLWIKPADVAMRRLVARIAPSHREKRSANAPATMLSAPPCWLGPIVTMLRPTAKKPRQPTHPGAMQGMTPGRPSARWRCPVSIAIKP